MTSQTKKRLLYGPMIRSQRTDIARIKAGRCMRHNALIVPSSTFDGGTCALGCIASNTFRHALLAKTRRGWRRG